MPTKSMFETYVRDALAHLYDRVHLEAHPIAEVLVPSGVPHETRVQALRERLRNAIDLLQPAVGVPFGRREWLPYRVLLLRFVQGMDPASVCHELAVGRRSLFRYQRMGIDAVTNLLWEQYAAAPAQGSALGENEALASLEREVERVAQETRRHWVNVYDVLASVKRTITSLLASEEVSLHFDTPGGLPLLHENPAVLRQIMLSALADCIRYRSSDSLHLSARVRPKVIEWQCGPLRNPAGELGLAGVSPGFDLCQTLADASGGNAWLEPDEGRAVKLCFQMPLRHPIYVLLIDDDADTINLFRRYLPPPRYEVHVAKDTEQLHRALNDAPPDIILLDILMPERDGWDILENLKAMPTTAATPVVVCSVVDQPRLALSLGAARVLQKPIHQETLLRTIREIVGRADRSGEARSAAPEDTPRQM